MRIGIAALLAGYVLSQFYRAFLAVLAPDLEAAVGAAPADLARASGAWFLAFAAMQLPIGWALDRIGPRWTASGLLALGGGGGAALFALAQGPTMLIWAMALIGVGCAPVLMAAYYIFARSYRAAVFGTLAGAMVGVGSLGNLAAALPLTLVVEAVGWRGAVWGLAGATLVVAGVMAVFVKDPPRAPPAPGGFLSVLSQPVLWPVLVLMALAYGPAVGIRGLWAGPYFAQVHGADAGLIGTLTLLMGLAMVAGSLAYGPLDRVFGTRKWVVLGGNVVCAGCLGALAVWPMPGLVAATVLICAVGLFGASFPMILAHGRAFFPPHLAGRGVTVLNLFSIGGAGVMQAVSGHVHASAAPGQGFAALFWFFALALAFGCAVYLFARDRTD